MRTALCLGVVIALSSTAFAREWRGDDTEDTRKTAVDKSAAEDFRLQQLTEELKAQRALLDVQRAEIDSLKTQSAAQVGMSINDPAIPADLLPADQAKAVPEDVKSKWGVNIYGFVEADFINDNRIVAGLVDGAGNPALPLPRTYNTTHGQTTFGARNSRIGLNATAPEYAGIRASGKLEMDFLGTNGGATSENNGTWTNPTFRIRHMYVKLDSDVVTIQLGQGWELFGWQPYFHPCTVDIQGVPGQVYSRSPKAQFSHAFKGPVDVEVGAALSRPPQRASNSPDIQAGVKVTIPEWVGVHTMGAASTAIDAAGFGISGVTRSWRIPNSAVAAVTTSDATRGDGAAFDLFLPILHPDKESRGNSLSFTGEIVYGKGMNDLYSGFSGGLGAPPAPGTIADGGSVGIIAGDLKAIQWRTDILGLQYYLPGDGTWWIAANYGSGSSHNIQKVTGAGAATVFHDFRFINVDLFWDVTPAVRLGLSVDQYRDGFIQETPNHFAYDTRIQLSAFFLF